MRTGRGVSNNVFMTNSVVAEIPGFLAGTWDIDPITSDVAFHVRHYLVRQALGGFNGFGGTVVTERDYGNSSVRATIDTNTVTTGGKTTDRHVRSARFLDVENYPTITFQSTTVLLDDGGVCVEGDLTIRGTTRPVVLDVTLTSFTSDSKGETRARFTATTEVSRNRFGVRPTGLLELIDNALILGDKVSITLKIEAALRADKSGVHQPG
jgi:polyisoprenoid-binding protein YceI